MRLALAAVSALVLAASACGGVEREHNLSEALAKTEQAGSARFELRGSETEGSRSTTMECRGAADYGRSRLQATCDFGGHGTLEWIAVGKTTYMRGTAAFAYGFAGDGWAKADNDESIAEQLSPQRLLTMLRGASRETERVGEDDIRGASTVRYRLEVECDEAELSCDGTTSVGVWIDEDGFVRRISYDIGTESATFEFYDFGAELEIRPPPPGEVRDIRDRTGTQPCKSGVGSPISDGRLLDALRAHGYAGVDREENCPKPIDALLGGSIERRATEPVVVSCFVFATSSRDAPTTTQRADSAGGVFRLANVQCTAFVTKPGPAADEAVRRLGDAFDELERSLRP